MTTANAETLNQEPWYKSGSITLVKNLQGHGAEGPSIKEQCALEPPPFEQAIRAASSMLVLHINTGSSCDPYRRVWVRPFPFIAPTPAWVEGFESQ